MFTADDYAAAAARLGAPIPHVKGLAQVESSGLTFWPIGGEMLPPVRLEAHRFGFHTGYRFDASHPDLSCRDWTPALAATTWDGAWDQVRRARQLDHDAADMATSWGCFQVMGENWRGLRYAGIGSLVAAMHTEAGQLDGFVRYIEADPALRRALALGDWRTVARLYNGPGQVDAYAAKMEAAALHFAGSPQSAMPRVLKVGDRGDDVRRLQEAIGIAADGVFGARTDAAVREFQRRSGLVVDGLVGPMTCRALGI